MDEDL